MEQEQEHRLCVIAFEASQQAHICRLAAAPQIFVRYLPLEKQWSVKALCSRAEASKAGAGQSSEDHA